MLGVEEKRKEVCKEPPPRSRHMLGRSILAEEAHNPAVAKDGSQAHLRKDARSGGRIGHPAWLLGFGSSDVITTVQVEDTALAMKLGKEAADYVSATFIKPIKLEFEKVSSQRALGRRFLSPTNHNSSLQIQLTTITFPERLELGILVKRVGSAFSVWCKQTGVDCAMGAGLLPIPAHQQETVCGVAVDQSPKVGQDGHQGES